MRRVAGVALLAVFAMNAPCHATAGRWLPAYGPPGTDGIAKVAAVHRDRLVIAGSFETVAGVTTGPVAAWDGAAWDALPPLDDASPSPPDFHAMTSWSGDLVVAATRYLEDRSHRHDVWRCDGASWVPMGESFDGLVYALGVHAGELHAGGSFDSIGGQSCRAIARWNGVAWKPLAAGVNGRVDAMLTFDGRLIAAGRFERAGSTPAANIAAWDGLAWSPLGTGLGGDVLALCVYRGQLLAAGDIGIRAWDGHTWRPLDGAPASDVSTLVEWGGRLVASGGFDWIGDRYVAGLAAWDGQSWSALAGRYAPLPGSSTGTFITYGDDLYYAGSYAPGPLQLRGIVRWDGEEWQAVGSQALVWRTLVPMRLPGRLVAGNAFAMGGDPPEGYLLEKGPGGWRATLGPVYDDYPRISRAVEYQGGMAIAGSFFRAGDLLTNNFAVWDGAAFTDFGAGLDTRSWISDLAVHDGDLVLAGQLGDAGGIDAATVVRWDGATWSDMSAGLERIPSPVIDLDGDLVCAAGSASYDAEYVYRWNGASWSPLDSTVVPRGRDAGAAGVLREIHSIGHWNGALVAGGAIHVEPDSVEESVVRWSGEGWERLGTAGGEYEWVSSITSYHGDLVVAGSFQTMDGVTAPGIARWNGISWEGMVEDMTFPVTFLHVVADTLFAGGAFSRFDGQPSSGLAAWVDGAEPPDVVPPRLTAGVQPDPLGATALDIWGVGSEALSPDSLRLELDAVPVAAALADPRLVRGRVTVAPGAGLHHVTLRARDRAGNPAETAIDFTLTPVLARTGATLRSPDGGLEVTLDPASVASGGLVTIATTPGAKGGYTIATAAANRAVAMTLVFTAPGVVEELGVERGDGVWLASVLDPVRGVIRAVVRGVGEYRLAPAPPGWRATDRSQVAFAVGDPAPAPFRPPSGGGAGGTALVFQLDRPGAVRARVLDVAGRTVATLLDAPLAAGAHRVIWQGRDTAGRTVAPGVYFIVIEAPGHRVSRKLAVLR